mmetsp:Transcript_56957/g.136905  ORF Transcript_56957/g.136905 Transcript_56957/m.136905 type:complete len:342 (+) Transcript_56957:806-1831(+)
MRSGGRAEAGTAGVEASSGSMTWAVREPRRGLATAPSGKTRGAPTIAATARTPASCASALTSPPSRRSRHQRRPMRPFLRATCAWWMGRRCMRGGLRSSTTASGVPSATMGGAKTRPARSAGSLAMQTPRRTKTTTIPTTTGRTMPSATTRPRTPPTAATTPQGSSVHPGRPGRLRRPCPDRLHRHLRGMSTGRCSTASCTMAAARIASGSTMSRATIPTTGWTSAATSRGTSTTAATARTSGCVASATAPPTRPRRRRCRPRRPSGKGSSGWRAATPRRRGASRSSTRGCGARSATTAGAPTRRRPSAASWATAEASPSAGATWTTASSARAQAPSGSTT